MARRPRLGSPGFRIHRDGVRVQRVVDDLAVGEGGAAIHQVAAGDALRRGGRPWLVAPLRRGPRAAQVERVEHVGEGRDDVHRRADYERSALVAAEVAGRERPGHLQVPHVPGVDLGEPAVAGARIVLTGAEPLPVFGLDRGGGEGLRWVGRARPGEGAATAARGRVGLPARRAAGAACGRSQEKAEGRAGEMAPSPCGARRALDSTREARRLQDRTSSSEAGTAELVGRGVASTACRSRRSSIASR